MLFPPLLPLLQALTKFIKQHAKIAYELPKKTKDSEDKEDAKEEL